MTNPYAANFEDRDGTIRLQGQVDFTDSGNQPGGGSAFIPARNVGQAEFDFDTGALSAFQVVPIPFVFGTGDAALIDVTDPLRPAPVEAGTYSMLATVHCAAGAADVAILFDDDYYSILFSSLIDATEAATAGGAAAAMPPWFCGAGSPFSVTLKNEAGDGAVFTGRILLQRST